MAAHYDSVLLQNRVENQEADLKRLLHLLESPLAAKYGATLVGLFKRIMSSLLHDLDALERRLQEGEGAGAWEELSDLRGRGQQLMEEAQAFLGGVAIQERALDDGMAETARKLADDYVIQGGVPWSPAVVLGRHSASDWTEDVVLEENPADSLVRLPIPRWDIWYLPLIAHDYGYWIAKRGQIKSFIQFVEEQIATVHRLLTDSPPAKEELALLLPEIRAIGDAQSHAQDLERFRAQSRPVLEGLSKRLKVHLWHLIADAFATYLAGPAYAHALLFLTLDPTNPFLEGEEASESAAARSRYLPADARRAAVVLQTLQDMDDRSKDDPYAYGAYTSELNLLKSVWERALQVSNNLERFKNVQDAMRNWSRRIFEGLQYNFGLQGNQTTNLWQKAEQELVPAFLDGAPTGLSANFQLVINAAWWCRPRYPDRIADILRDCERLLAGVAPRGLNAKPREVQDPAMRLLESRLYDLETDLRRFGGLFCSEKIEAADRSAVAGRFYRLLSEQEYGLKKLKRFVKMDNPLSSSLLEVIRRSRGEEMNELQQEVLDFLGGTLMRKEALDGGICALAEALLHDYARTTGVNWASRAILGKNPLFSQASDMIYVRFPDWDVWDLPLMAHEFGHVTAFATPAFLSLLAEEVAVSTQGHPEAGGWDEKQTQVYCQKRARHIHEFFADAFAVYCQGPAFTCDVVVSHLNPVEAYLQRGDHPSHGERVEVILRTLEEMNNQEELDQYDPGSYASMIRRLKDWWYPAVEKAGVQPDAVFQFHKLRSATVAQKVFNVLDKYYHLGAQYEADCWKRAGEIAQSLLTGKADLSDANFCQLLNIAWACRVLYPDRAADIAKTIRTVYEQRLGQVRSAGA